MIYRDGYFWDDGRAYSTEPIVYKRMEDNRVDMNALAQKLTEECETLKVYTSDERALRIPIYEDEYKLYAICLFERVER